MMMLMDVDYQKRKGHIPYDWKVSLKLTLQHSANNVCVVHTPNSFHSRIQPSS